jgi:hypothetical protein
MRASALLLGLMATLLGCGGARCPRVAFTTADELLSSYRTMRSPARVVTAEARVERRDPGGRIRGTVFMMLERPDHVRFDAMTQFGPAAILTSDGTTFALADLRENRFFSGPTCAENIARLLGIPMEGEEVAGLILGETPVLRGESAVVCEGGRYRVTVTELPDEGGRSQVLEYAVREGDDEAAPLDQRLRLMRSSRFLPDGALEWRVTYEDYRVVADPTDTETPARGVAMPFRIRFEHPSQSIDTEVRVQSIELNADIPESSFVQEARPGLFVEPVECGG